MGQWLAEHVPEDSLLFTDHPDAAYGVRDHRRHVRVALPNNDGFADLLPLTHYHTSRHRPVYAAFHTRLWQGLAQVPALESYRMEPVSQHRAHVLMRIHPPATLTTPTTK